MLLELRTYPVLIAVRLVPRSFRRQL